MILKDYQKRGLETVRGFLEHLAEWRDKSAAAERIDMDFAFDWVSRAWDRAGIPGSCLPRRNGIGEPLPSFCLKIPTGGGKTLLALKVIDAVNLIYRRRQTGLVLWVVPTTQIYSQTLTSLKDRDHPYRQQLDLASAGKTLILEKNSTFGPQDVEERLCVLLLMLPSANRETQAQLRMFRDSGGYDRFFPSGDRIEAHRELVEQIPNLDTFETEGAFWGPQIKTSLGNVLRRLKPLMILDEGHKAYSPKAKATLEGFNPCMIVELSATPPRGANVLVNISGKELLAEQMIKLDLHISNLNRKSWKDVLLASIEHRRRLEELARQHEAESGIHIRPICLIQVERTGRDQRGADYIHAEDVREYLLQHPGIEAQHIAVKTSQSDELKEIDETGGLLSRNCPIRFIITKQALQEGWDCAFAYSLTVLTNPGSKSALTQLVGRILRQPYAEKTGVPALDESYVFCYRRRGADLLKEVRKGFGLEGLQGLEGKIAADVEDPLPGQPIDVQQRASMQTAARNLVLPAFMIKDGTEWRPVHYEADILSQIPWENVGVSELANLTLGEGIAGDAAFRAGLDDEQILVDENSPGDGFVGRAGVWNGSDMDYYFAAHHLRDVMPNPWRGKELAVQAFEALLKRYSAEQVAANYLLILEELRKSVEAQRDSLSQSVFHNLLDNGAMRFLVVADDLNFNRLPGAIQQPVNSRQANREDGSQYQLSLFERVSEDELNGLENKVATYMDQQERLFFWYRNRARSDYYVQGWKPGRIYADFIFTLRGDEPDTDDAFHRVFVVETKGLHLAHSADTTYKRSVFNICTEHAKRQDWAEFVPAMRGKVMRFEIVDEQEWENRLNAMVAG